MIRRFMPVGQGCFTIEEFECGKNVVFDCGTTTSIGKKIPRKQILLNQMKKMHMRNKDSRLIMDKVFISHFHEDHINGLSLLLDKCHVNTIYLPYLTPSEQIITLTLMCDYLEDSDDLLYQNLVTGKKINEDDSKTNVIYVSAERNRNENIQMGVMHSGQSIITEYAKGDIKPWVYIPYTFDNKTRTAQFINQLHEKGINDEVQNEILNTRFWKNRTLIKMIKEAYESICHDINLTNMVVYSGTDEVEGKCVQYVPVDICSPKMEKGCLYMGDYCIKDNVVWNDLRDVYKDVWDKIGTFTVPHHGSSKNYNVKFADVNAYYVINAGSKNKYQHPNKGVLRLLAEKERSVFWVNELDTSEAVFLVYYPISIR